MEPKRILVIEDDQDIRENLHEILGMEGHVVLTAENGQVGIDLLLSQLDDLPGCIILDLSMPVMDGVTFMKTIYAHHRATLGNIPVLIATAKGSAVDASEIPIAVEYMRKPIDLTELISMVERHCGRPA